MWLLPPKMNVNEKTLTSSGSKQLRIDVPFLRSLFFQIKSERIPKTEPGTGFLKAIK